MCFTGACHGRPRVVNLPGGEATRGPPLLRACSSARLERHSDKVEVPGSNPGRPTVRGAISNPGLFLFAPWPLAKPSRRTPPTSVTWPGENAILSSRSPLDPWNERKIERGHSFAAEAFKLRQATLRALDEARNVHAGGFGLELLETAYAASQETGCSLPVPVLLVVEADSDLEDALVEVADPARLFSPCVLQVLVALEELAPVELLYAPQCEVG